METSQQPLSIESFSYSWLVNLKPPSFESLDNSLRTSLDASDEASFIEMDPTMPPSQRFFRIPQQDFKFDSQSPLSTLVHADELISNGYLLPLSVDDPLKNIGSYDDYYDQASSNSSTANIPVSSSKEAFPTDKTSADCSNSLRKCRRLSKRIFEKYLDFLKPLYKRITGGHKVNHKAAGNHLDKRFHSAKNSRVYSSETASPRISVAYSAPDDWRRSCDSESSIYEAVLHCKRSIGN
ncbi:probable membrane-associated kinase regulator 6 [Argentina anserina]|uniref:probable membrane-associated kinase regulator 6 n=1 Tax=Argentina anserina TaxID=57926 RepID=UPI0021768B96|nr:probable membrane-associated kinase regulator 6 [Potentilla anserina]